MTTRRAALAAISAAALAAGAFTPAWAQDKGTIGIAMPTQSSARWISDGASMVEQFEAAGYDTVLQYAEDDIPNQLSQIEGMISQGVDALVIAADTTVALDGEWLAKPEDDLEATSMLARLRGREHQVFTGVAVASAAGGQTAQGGQRETGDMSSADDLAGSPAVPDATRRAPERTKQAIVERESRPVRAMLDHIWSSTHDDYRGHAGARWPAAMKGKRTILVFCGGLGTVLKLLDDLTDEEIAAKLPVQLRHLPALAA